MGLNGTQMAKNSDKSWSLYKSDMVRSMSRVLFALEWLPSYRSALLDGLRKRLASDGIELNLVHGQPPAEKASTGTNAGLAWGQYRENKTIRIKGVRFCVQPVRDLVREHDAVIVQQEAGLWLNFQLATRLVRPRVGWAMWGHGKHFIQDDVSGTSEKLKAWETRRTDHFFAYTETSRASAMETGLSADRITVVRNTLPSSSSGDPDVQIEALAQEISSRTEHVGILVSSLDKWKRLPFLREVLLRVRESVPDFEFIVVGKGDCSGPLESLAKSNPWIHLVGPQFDVNKARLGAISQVTIHPGLVGLHIVDAFRLECPMVTTTVDYHSHELDYLEPGSNGIIIPRDGGIDEMAHEVVRILVDRGWRDSLIAEGVRTSEGLTIESSIERFRSGIHKMLG